MPLYIRYLKPPRCTLSGAPKRQHIVVSALVTITSDLGESFYPYQATLKCDLFAMPKFDSSSNNMHETHSLSSTKMTWNAGFRNMKIEMSAPTPDGFLAKRDCELVLRVASENPRSSDNLLEYAPGSGIGILSAWSAPFKAPHSGAGTSAGGFVERRLQLKAGCTLRIWEETGESIARHIWDGGIALAAYLAQHHESSNGPLSALHTMIQQTKPLKVVELGSGCGIVGLAFAALWKSCHVLLTDLESAEEISERNIEYFLAQSQGRVSFRTFDWEDPVPPSVCPDIILIADCTYNPDSAVSLVHAIEKCVNGSKETVILLAHKKRHDSETLFFDLMKEKYQMVNRSEFSTLPVEGKLRNQDPFSGIGAEVVDLYIFKLLPE